MVDQHTRGYLAAMEAPWQEHSKAVNGARIKQLTFVVSSEMHLSLLLVARRSG
jgi:hypothetical protein